MNIWADTFDASLRHCWNTKDGDYTLEDGGGICNNWKKHPYRAGTVEFMRWIREFGVLAPGIVTGFKDGWLKLGPHKTISGTELYCENYGNVVKVFMDREKNIALIEVHDVNLIGAAEKASELVDIQYMEMSR